LNWEQRSNTQLSGSCSREHKNAPRKVHEREIEKGPHRLGTISGDSGEKSGAET